MASPEKADISADGVSVAALRAAARYLIVDVSELLPEETAALQIILHDSWHSPSVEVPGHLAPVLGQLLAASAENPAVD